MITALRKNDSSESESCQLTFVLDGVYNSMIA